METRFLYKNICIGFGLTIIGMLGYITYDSLNRYESNTSNCMFEYLKSGKETGYIYKFEDILGGTETVYHVDIKDNLNGQKIGTITGCNANTGNKLYDLSIKTECEIDKLVLKFNS